MKKILSNVAAGATQAVILTVALYVILEWRGGEATFGMAFGPMMLAQFFMFNLVIMALAFGGLQSLWEMVAGDIGLKGGLSDALGCAATMLLFGGITLAAGGAEQPNMHIAVAFFTVAAFFSGFVRHWVAR